MKKTILSILCILFALMMINGGLNKIFEYMPMPELTEAQMTRMNALMTIGWLFPLIAITEIVGGLLIAIPKYRALGAIIIFPVIVGILLHHIVYEQEGIILGVALFGINLWAILDNWKKYLPMIE